VVLVIQDVICLKTRINREPVWLAVFFMRITKSLASVLLVNLLVLSPVLGEPQTLSQFQEMTGSISYCDDYYFVVIRAAGGIEDGAKEIGFLIKDDIILPPRIKWADVTQGMAVRVRYEEFLAPQKARFGGLETEIQVVKDRRAVQLWIEQELPPKKLVSK